MRLYIRDPEDANRIRHCSQESDSLAVFSELLRYTSVRELSLCNARLHLAVHEGPLSRLGRRDDAGAELLRAAPPPACPAIVFLRLAGFQVSEHPSPEYRSAEWGMFYQANVYPQNLSREITCDKSRATIPYRRLYSYNWLKLFLSNRTIDSFASKS